MYSTLSANLSGRVRRAKLHGRDHLVAPLTMIVPGVLHGSNGPLYYPPEELERDPEAWNHVPIVVEHPMFGGEGISARDPDVLNSHAIGVVLRAHYDGKLSAEGWFDVERTSEIAPHVLKRLRQGKPIELSTGLHSDVKRRSGTHNGKPFEGIARNYRPDHLAILPNQAGACSIRDGCGVLVNGDDDLTEAEIDWALNKMQNLRDDDDFDDDDVLPRSIDNCAMDDSCDCDSESIDNDGDLLLPSSTHWQ